MGEKKREFTGRHAAIIFVGAFTVIIGVNIALAVNAVRTFPGLEVKNSYVASQEFNDRKAAQEALGWTVAADAGDGFVRIRITDDQGLPVHVASLDATVGRATQIKDDVHPEFNFDGRAYIASVDLGPGNWNIRMKAVARNGTEFVQRIQLPLSGKNS